MRNRPLPISMALEEQRWGLRYLLFELVFLGSLLGLALSLLLGTYTSAQLNFLYFAVNLAAAVWIFRRYLRRSLEDLPNRAVRAVVVALVGYLLYQALNYSLSWLIGRSFPGFFNVNDASIGSSAREGFWLMALGTVFLAPAAEELFHRGLIFGSVHRRSRWLAYLVSTALFAWIHVSGYLWHYAPLHLALCFLQYIPGGLVLAWAYEQSGTIFCPIAIHMAINAVGVLSMR